MHVYARMHTRTFTHTRARAHVHIHAHLHEDAHEQRRKHSGAVIYDTEGVKPYSGREKRVSASRGQTQRTAA